MINYMIDMSSKLTRDAIVSSNLSPLKILYKGTWLHFYFSQSTITEIKSIANTK